MGCTQYLDLAQEHRSSILGLVRLKPSDIRAPLFTSQVLILLPSLDYPSLYITDYCLLAIVQSPRDKG
jgi:hypothetical protein